MSRIYFRNATLEPAIEGAEVGTMRLSFASDLPVTRKDSRGLYHEILSQVPGDVNLGFLNKRGLVLEDHDENTEIGEVVRNSASVEADKKTRATIKVTDAAWQNKIKTDARAIPVSVGYTLLSVLKEERGADAITIRTYSWQPYEISLLNGEPADDTVGFYRMKKRLCGNCGGVGTCPACDGDGDEECADCSGNKRCSDCSGNGYMATARSKPVDSSKTIESVIANLTPEEKQRMKILLSPEPAAGGGVATITPADALTAERTRVKEIDAIGAELETSFPGSVKEIRALVQEARSSDMSLGAFQGRAMKEVIKAKEVKPVTMRALGVSEAEFKSYSLSRAVQKIIKAGYRDKVPADGFEREMHDEMMKANPDQSGGFLIPADAPIVMGGADMRSAKLMRGAVKAQRDMTAGVFGQGGATVATQLITPIIEILRNRMVCDRLGVRTMAGLSGNIAIPRQTAAGTAYSVAEIAALTVSNQVLDQISMTPRRVGAQGIYSEQLLLQSSIDVENFVRDDLLKVIAIDWDRLILNGQGAASEPLGILNVPGINSITFGGAATWANIVKFETLVASFNADIGTMSYVTTPTAKGQLKTLAKLFTGATTVAAFPLWDGTLGDSTADGVMNGYRAAATNQIPNNVLLFGVFDQAILGLWGGYQVIVDPYTKAGSAETVITMNTFGDVAVRHAQSFTASSDSAAQ